MKKTTRIIFNSLIIAILSCCDDKAEQERYDTQLLTNRISDDIAKCLHDNERLGLSHSYGTIAISDFRKILTSLKIKTAYINKKSLIEKDYIDTYACEIVILLHDDVYVLLFNREWSYVDFDMLDKNSYCKILDDPGA